MSVIVLKVIKLVQLDAATQALSETSINYSGWRSRTYIHTFIDNKGHRSVHVLGRQARFPSAAGIPSQRKKLVHLELMLLYFLAKRDNDLNQCSCSFHQLSGFESMAFCGSDVNTANCRLMARGVSSSESDIAGISVSLSSSI